MLVFTTSGSQPAACTFIVVVFTDCHEIFVIIINVITAVVTHKRLK